MIFTFYCIYKVKYAACQKKMPTKDKNKAKKWGKVLSGEVI